MAKIVIFILGPVFGLKEHFIQINIHKRQHLLRKRKTLTSEKTGSESQLWSVHVNLGDLISLGSVSFLKCR